MCVVENIPLKKQVLLLEEVQKLNRENAEKSGEQLSPAHLDLEAGVAPKGQQLEGSEDSQVAAKDEVVEAEREEEVGEKGQEAEGAGTEKLDVEDVVKESEDKALSVPEEQEGIISREEEAAEAPELPVTQEDEKEPTATR